MCIRDSLLHRIIIYIAAEFPVFIAVHTYVNHNCPWLYHICRHKLRFSDCGHKDIRLAAHFGKIFCLAVTDGNLSLIHISIMQL